MSLALGACARKGGKREEGRNGEEEGRREQIEKKREEGRYGEEEGKGKRKEGRYGDEEGGGNKWRRRRKRERGDKIVGEKERK